jgi:hypothetical protein
VQTPQPNTNPNQTLTQKQLFQQRLMKEEVVVLTSLLLIQKIKPINKRRPVLQNSGFLVLEYPFLSSSKQAILGRKLAEQDSIMRITNDYVIRLHFGGNRKRSHRGI